MTCFRLRAAPSHPQMEFYLPHAVRVVGVPSWAAFSLSVYFSNIWCHDLRAFAPGSRTSCLTGAATHQYQSLCQALTWATQRVCGHPSCFQAQFEIRSWLQYPITLWWSRILEMSPGHSWCLTSHFCPSLFSESQSSLSWYSSDFQKWYLFHRNYFC